jgi:hypothetical protein
LDKEGREYFFKDPYQSVDKRSWHQESEKFQREDDDEDEAHVVVDAMEEHAVNQVFSKVLAKHGVQTCATGEGDDLDTRGVEQGTSNIAEHEAHDWTHDFGGISKAFSEFNKNIPPGTNDRKGRFRQQKMLRARQLLDEGDNAREVDNDLDYLSGDDDAAIAFEMEGKKDWQLANVRQVAQLTAHKDATKLSQDALQKAPMRKCDRLFIGVLPLICLLFTCRLRVVPVDDARGVVKVLWYLEEDEVGNLLSGDEFNHPACTGYRLPTRATYRWR